MPPHKSSIILTNPVNGDKISNVYNPDQDSKSFMQVYWSIIS